MNGTPHRIDRVLLNGRILTVDADFSEVQALALRDGQIVATGSTAEILSLIHI